MSDQASVMTVTLYRITWSDRPTVDDMTSNAALGKPLRGNDPKLQSYWQGISLWDSLDQARGKARGNPWKGNAYIAELAIPVGVFRLKPTFAAGHHTLWGDPYAILACVKRVHSV